MIPYILAFALSYAFVARAGALSSANAAVRPWLMGLGLLPVCALAGLRADGVGGPDSIGYGTPLFKAAARVHSFSELTAVAATRFAIKGERGYLFLNYLLSRWTDNQHWFYFVAAVVTHGIALVAAIRLRTLVAPRYVWLVYLLTVYPASYNLIRQSLALSLALLGIALVLTGKPRWGLVWGAAGLLFHGSAVVFIPMWALTAYLIRREKVSFGVVALVVIGCVGTVSAGAQFMASVASHVGGSKYDDYLQPGAKGGKALGTDVLYRLAPIIFGWALVGRKALFATARERARLATLTLLLLIEFVLLPVREYGLAVYRVLLYFGDLRVIQYPLIISALPSLRPHLARLALVVFSAIYFYVIFFVQADSYYRSDVISWLR